MSSTRRAARLATIAVAAALACLAGTGTSSALGYEWDSASPSGSSSGTCTSTVGAHVCFVGYGDRLFVHDTAADGASAVLDWYIQETFRQGGCRNSMGNGSWGVCNKDFGENNTIVFRACTYDANHNLWGCGPWASARV